MNAYSRPATCPLRKAVQYSARTGYLSKAPLADRSCGVGILLEPEYDAPTRIRGHKYDPRITYRIVRQVPLRRDITRSLIMMIYFTVLIPPSFFFNAFFAFKFAHTGCTAWTAFPSLFSNGPPRILGSCHRKVIGRLRGTMASTNVLALFFK
ncbi:hypothetical protein DFS33DRAFT_318115 [Desarmillaria ectypa]|nr:hypothetical protein DFS33DRAFT_318115 [Desarmillaria ectypa]